MAGSNHMVAKVIHYTNMSQWFTEIPNSHDGSISIVGQNLKVEYMYLKLSSS